ncbi:hypothetical protein DB30_01450 [Enhygromyxa salina]|uniref:Uncharacterized protein n=2 Tax=Enhygromyxa salina TaxID=215803 RepID=A0A0C1ZMZ5_9BACT|nr:hypothetical protein DB30_01450 [Enhygromyxa salina]
MVSEGDEITVADARPIRRGRDKLAVHAIGRLTLSRREQALIASWLERRKRSRALAGDFLATIARPRRDPVTGRIISREQSCAGLVFECLQTCLRIDLVDLEALPRSTRARLVALWGEKVVMHAEHRGELVGAEPWPVLLPAHILHALATEDPRPHTLRASATHWDFPS